MVRHFTLHVCPWGHRGSQEGRWPQGAQHSASSPGYFLPEPFPPPVQTQWEFCLKCLSSGFPRKWNEELSLSAKLWCYLLHSEGCCCCSVVSNSLNLLNYSKPDCPPLSPGVCSNSCPLSPWCYLAISSSAAHFSFCLQSFPALRPLPVKMQWMHFPMKWGEVSLNLICPFNKS